ncbi:hypothetical protein [Mycolicibacterium peregrinum]|uniref:hypothetical protein n=1 Tax=Mycolicibacterium peregrinum TaxID=43304 RepID=UPI00146F6622|nr:hypothetical protein [Mycolicibacterium peregrinum]
MDPIDELVDAQLDGGPPDRALTVDICPICKFAWHGFPKNGCPGSYTAPNS